jgi:Importin-beta N-terminal domain
MQPVAIVALDVQQAATLLDSMPQYMRVLVGNKLRSSMCPTLPAVGAFLNRSWHAAHDQPVLCVDLQYQHSPGQLTNLLRVAVEDSLDAAVRQVAAITFKNLVKADWDAQGEHARSDPNLARK